MNSVDQLDRPVSSEAGEVEGRRHVLAVHRSRKRIAPFRLHRPVDTGDAIAMLADRPRACVVAGGSDVINRMKCGEVIDDVVSIGHLESLRRIDVTRGILQIGAVCTHHDLATSAAVGHALPALAQQWGRIATPRVRFKGTVGGNLMARHPDYEGRALLAAVGATLRYATPHGPRLVTCADQFAAPRDERGWLLEGIEVALEADTRIDYDRSLKGIAGVVVGLTIDGDRIVHARAATTWAYADLHCAALPVAGASVSQLRAEAAAVAGEWVSRLPQPMTNHLATGRYRRKILEIQLRRALERAAGGRPA